MILYKHNVPLLLFLTAYSTRYKSFEVLPPVPLIMTFNKASLPPLTFSGVAWTEFLHNEDMFKIIVSQLEEGNLSCAQYLWLRHQVRQHRHLFNFPALFHRGCYKTAPQRSKGAWQNLIYYHNEYLYTWIFRRLNLVLI